MAIFRRNHARSQRLAGSWQHQNQSNHFLGSRSVENSSVFRDNLVKRDVLGWTTRTWKYVVHEKTRQKKKKKRRVYTKKNGERRFELQPFRRARPAIRITWATWYQLDICDNFQLLTALHPYCIPISDNRLYWCCRPSVLAPIVALNTLHDASASPNSIHVLDFLANQLERRYQGFEGKKNWS